MVDIDNLTFSELKTIFNMFASSKKNHPFDVGGKYLFRTVTHIDVGVVVDVCGDFVKLDQASWIADTGRYHDCLSEGRFKEVEPYPNCVYLNIATLIDAAPWDHDLPTEQK